MTEYSLFFTYKEKVNCEPFPKNFMFNFAFGFVGVIYMFLNTQSHNFSMIRHNKR